MNLYVAITDENNTLLRSFQMVQDGSDLLGAAAVEALTSARFHVVPDSTTYHRYTVVISYGENAAHPAECYTHHVRAPTPTKAEKVARAHMDEANGWDYGTADGDTYPIVAVYNGYLENLA
jgi:hypothetical protein